MSRRSSWVRACCLPDVALLWVQLDRVNGKAATELRQNGNFVALWSTECDDAEALLGRWGGGDAMIRHAHERADFEVRKAKRPDMYAALGTTR